MATKEQAQIIVGKMSEHHKKFLSLSDDDAEYVIKNAKEAVDIFVCAIANRSESAAKVAVSIINTFEIPAMNTNEKFIAKDKFKEGNLFFSDNFKTWFFNKTEKNFADGKICCYKLENQADDLLIISNLGSNNPVETALFELSAMLDEQPRGGSGPLLRNGENNIFYIRDVDNVLRTVCIYWDDNDGWSIEAHLVGSSKVWSAGNSFFIHQ